MARRQNNSYTATTFSGSRFEVKAQDVGHALTVAKNLPDVATIQRNGGRVKGRKVKPYKCHTVRTNPQYHS